MCQAALHGFHPPHGAAFCCRFGDVRVLGKENCWKICDICLYCYISNIHHICLLLSCVLANFLLSSPFWENSPLTCRCFHSGEPNWWQRRLFSCKKTWSYFRPTCRRRMSVAKLSLTFVLPHLSTLLWTFVSYLQGHSIEQFQPVEDFSDFFGQWKHCVQWNHRKQPGRFQ